LNIRVCIFKIPDEEKKNDRTPGYRIVSYGIEEKRSDAQGQPTGNTAQQDAPPHTDSDLPF
jgi:hypothetical protein